MSPAVLNSITIFIILFIGYTLKKYRLLDRELSRRLSFVVMYITLPCAIVSSGRGTRLDLSLTAVMGVSFVFNAVMLLTPLIFLRPSRERLFAMMNVTGFNIGNFSLPFLAAMLSAEGFLALAFFDLINAFFIFGGSYSVALLCNRAAAQTSGVSFKTILRELSKSLPSYAYLAVIALAALQLELPDVLQTPLRTIGSANTFIVMLIIGSSISFDIDLGRVRSFLRIIGLRYIPALCLAAAAWILLPFGAEIRVLLMVIALSPLASINAVMTLRKLPDYAENSALLCSLTVLISLPLVAVLTSVFTF